MCRVLDMKTTPTLRWIFYVIPVPVVYAGWLVGKGFSATSYGVFVAIRPDYKEDHALLEHELQHCRQFYRSFGLNALLYWLSKKHRYRLELEAYRVQLAHQPNHLRRSRAELYAGFIADDYGLRVDRERALGDLLS